MMTPEVYDFFFCRLLEELIIIDNLKLSSVQTYVSGKRVKPPPHFGYAYALKLGETLRNILNRLETSMKPTFLFNVAIPGIHS